MNHTNKSISDNSLSCVATIASKRNSKAFGIINGKVAAISDLEPQGKICPFDR